MNKCDQDLVKKNVRPWNFATWNLNGVVPWTDPEVDLARMPRLLAESLATYVLCSRVIFATTNTGLRH